MKRLFIVFLVSCSESLSPTPDSDSRWVGDLTESLPVKPDGAIRQESAISTTLVRVETKFKGGAGVAARMNNLRLVAKSLNGTKIWPRSTISFNDIVGPRTVERGYVPAPSYFMGETTESVGGGTCQVSTTLYQAAIMAGLEIVERMPHSRPSTYASPGTDAMVNYPEECWNGRHDPTVCHDLKVHNPNWYGFDIVAGIEEPSGSNPGVMYVTFWAYGDFGPEVKHRWIQTSTTPADTRRRRVPWLKGAEPKLKQKGVDGMKGWLDVTQKWPDGTIKKVRFNSSYKGVPEIWEVGPDWKAE